MRKKKRHRFGNGYLATQSKTWLLETHPQSLHLFLRLALAVKDLIHLAIQEELRESACHDITGCIAVEGELLLGHCADKVNGTDQLRTQDDAICLEKVFNT